MFEEGFLEEVMRTEEEEKKSHRSYQILKEDFGVEYEGMKGAKSKISIP